MTTPPARNPQAREDGLAARLRRARDEMPGKELAARADWVQSKVSKIENGKQLPTRSDLVTWAQITNSGDQLELWTELLTEARQARQEWAARLRDNGQTGLQQDYSAMVAAATKLEFFETAYIPRFFQVPGYTRGVLTWVNERFPGAADIDEATTVRQADVAYLYTDKSFDLLIAEPVLYWRHPAITDDVMRQQLDRLLTVGALPNVRFGILPLATPHRIWPEHSFEIYGEVMTLETFYGEQQVHDEEEIVRYRLLLDRAWETAVTGEKARQLIRDAMDTLPRTRGT
jgi:transcriptional regulator with XRE-family HTH domain